MTPLADLSRVRTMLCIGAHSDDIEIGAGATILRIQRENPAVRIGWVVLSGDSDRHFEASESARAFVPGQIDLHLQSFTDRFFPAEHVAIKRFFDFLKTSIEPDLIFTHTRDDRHQDHRVVCELTWNTFRDHQILEYEIPKWDGELPTPNVFVDVDNELANRKCELLMQHFGSQRSKRWFDEETFKGLMRLRGVESGTKYAEGFVARKWIV